MFWAVQTLLGEKSHILRLDIHLILILSSGPLVFVYYDDIEELYANLSQKHSSSDWRLFIDSSKRSLKAVLLHNGNLKPGIPIAHSSISRKPLAICKKFWMQKT